MQSLPHDAVFAQYQGREGARCHHRVLSEHGRVELATTQLFDSSMLLTPQLLQLGTVRTVTIYLHPRPSIMQDQPPPQEVGQRTQ